MWNSEDAKKAVGNCSKGPCLKESAPCPVGSAGDAEGVGRVRPIDLGEKDS